MLKVAEVARLLGVSKVTIYNKLKLHSKELKPHLSKLKGVIHIDGEGLEIIRDSLNLQGEVKTEDIKADRETTYSPDNTEALNELLRVKNERLKDLKEHIKHLESQAQEKDNLISDQSRQLEQFQILLLNEKEKTKLLETEKQAAGSTIWERLRNKFKK